MVKNRGGLGTVFGLFNMRKTGSPWSDLRLRRAANLAVNRADLIRYGARGNGAIIPALLPARAFGHDPALAPYARIDCHAETVMAYFDRSQLEQVMINLLKNAQEAGGPLESIALSTTVASNGVTRFVVSDRGLGMSAQVLENAMLPFYSTKERGTGLGLALCREIVEAHGGSIRVENRPEGGVSVTCELPGHEPPPKSAAAKLTLSRL